MPAASRAWLQGGGAAVVAAGLQGHDRRAALAPHARLAQGAHFGVG